MTSTPTVSVVVPVHNRATLIAETLDSILCQTYEGAVEVIAVDDGSTDDTPRVLKRYADRIRVITQPNQGAAEARNTAIRTATGEWIAFCDSDDLWPPDKLERQLDCLRQRPNAGMIYGDCIRFEIVDGQRREWRSQEPTPSGFILEALFKRNFLTPAAVVVRRDVLDAAGLFDPDCCNAEDYDLFLRIAARAQVVYSGTVGAYYRQHPDTASRQPARYFRGFVRSLEKARDALRQMHQNRTLREPIDGRNVPVYQVQEWDALIRRRLASFHLRLVHHLSREGNIETAWTECVSALRLTPTRLDVWRALWRVLRQRLGFRRPRP